jgi:hypothetical protein
MNALRTWSLCWVVSSLVACSMPATDARIHGKLPDRDSFDVVAQVLERHCGSLDCHGSSYRNLRLYGNDGLRLEATDRPLTPECTTPDEIEQDYDSLVGLEPEILTAVVTSKGARPERLTFIRKARGTEDHKGGTLMKTGDDIDSCLTSWLASQVDEDACSRSLPENTCF